MENKVGMRLHNGIHLPVYYNKKDAAEMQSKPNPYLRKPEDRRYDFYVNDTYYKNLKDMQI